MENLYCNKESLITESDVEQKFLYKLLSGNFPTGLGYTDLEIATKSTLKTYLINKGTQQKYYVPDYLISIRGIPQIVIEAKKPDINLNEAFAEAQLYANQINSKFPHKINPCQYIIVSNGNETWVGYFDNKEPVYQLKFSDFNSENLTFNELLEFCSKNVLYPKVNEIYIKNKANAIYKSPVSDLGGKNTINSEMYMNDFGNALVVNYRNIFDPQTEDDRIEIVKNAYVHSQRREQHIEPIYKEIKKIKHPSLRDTALISTNNPTELVEKVQNIVRKKEQQYPLILLIGKRGSGKTTFVRYFKNEIIDDKYENLSAQCEWSFLDMNYAPLDKNLIYEWVKNNIINSIKKSYENIIDFDTKEVIEKLYKPEIESFKKGEGKYLENNIELYNKELFTLVKELKSNSEKTLFSFIKYMEEEENKHVLVVFDNCDKKNKEEQLLLFEVAQWLRQQFKCIVMLPMRDITYDMYKDVPPLDTFVRDLVFRIDAPDLLKVLISRLEYIERLNKTNIESHYTLKNDIRVRIKPTELIDYYRQILHVIRNDHWAKNIFYRLSNGDLRYAIQLFEDLCRSGHINTTEILNMKLLGTEYKLQPHKIMNALLRKNRKYYDEYNSDFINLFSSDFKDDIPDPFIRLDILYWLSIQKNTMGTNQIIGFQHIKRMAKDLLLYGHKEDVIFRELKYLIKKGLVLEENQTENININDLVKISMSGSLHLQLLKNVSYLAACSEAVLYRNTEIKNSISKRLALPSYLELNSQVENALEMLDYLIEYQEKYFADPTIYIKEVEVSERYNILDSKETTNNLVEELKLKKLLFGKDVECIVQHLQKNAVLVTFNNESYNERGFLAVNEPLANLTEEQYNKLNINDTILCRVLSYDETHNSFKMMLLE